MCNLLLEERCSILFAATQCIRSDLWHGNQQLQTGKEWLQYMI